MIQSLLTSVLYFDRIYKINICNHTHVYKYIASFKLLVFSAAFSGTYVPYLKTSIIVVNIKSARKLFLLAITNFNNIALLPLQLS